MKRILCIGNSHAAAMRYGWEAVSAGHEGVSVDFLSQHLGQTPQCRDMEPIVRQLDVRQ